MTQPNPPSTDAPAYAPPGDAPASQYPPPPGAPPASSQYAPPPGAPPPTTEYAPPSGPPPASASENPFADDIAPSDVPPPYSKRAPAGSTPHTDPSQPSVRFVALSGQPTSSSQPSRSSQPSAAPSAGPSPTGGFEYLCAPSDDAHRPLDPPPACFSTPTPLRIRSSSFQPFVIPGAGPSLAHGFEFLYAPEQLGPHGISEKDWAELLRGAGAAARLALRGVSAIAPDRGSVRARGIGLLAGPRGAAGGPFDRSFTKSPEEEVMALLDVWNGSALERRKVRVSLHARAERVGPGAPPGKREGWEILVEAL